MKKIKLTPTRAEIEKYCECYAATIMVRVLEKGRWENKTLAECLPSDRALFVDRWANSGFYPARMANGTLSVTPDYPADQLEGRRNET